MDLTSSRQAFSASTTRGSKWLPLPERMRVGLSKFTGDVLFIFSGADLTAKEFLDLAGGSAEWRKLLDAPRVTRHDLAEADHTFSRRAWRDQVTGWTAGWMRLRGQPARGEATKQSTFETSEES